MIYEMTWDEVCAAGYAGKSLIATNGTPFFEDGFTDIKHAYKQYHHNVAEAVSIGHTIPEKVMLQHQQVIDAHPAFELPKPAFAWSFSAINDFINCPLSYAHNRIWKTIKFVETEHIKTGNEAHKAMEMRVAFGTPLPAHLAKHEKYCTMFDKVARGHELHAERQLCINQNMELVPWFDAKAWGRCKLDVIIFKDGTVYIYDWKTGKVSDNLLQMKMSAAFAALIYPGATKFVTRYIGLKGDTVTPVDGSGDFTIEQIPGIWAEIMSYVHRMAIAIAMNSFQPRPSGLCGWCQVTNCSYRR